MKEPGVKALLVLADGRTFAGRGFGAPGEVAAEVVFNTGMAGYQELLTDPSYFGQIVNMTYPLIGNYGVNATDMESSKIQVAGFIVRELCRWPSNFRSQKSLENWFIEKGMLGIEGIDTRALTRHIRTTGSMNGVLSTTDLSVESLKKKAQAAPNMAGLDLVKNVTCQKSYEYRDPAVPVKRHVVLVDCGVKTNIERELGKRGCRVTVVPAFIKAEEILALKPDGLMLSNGPGDPAAVTYLIATLKQLIGKLPMFGICLGHQLLGLALGGRTCKLKFGHRGVNHPVQEIATGRVAITSQNHGFCVEMDSLPTNVEATHINTNDRTVEGLRHKTLPIFAVQYHPEASPGPNDAKELFDRFVKLMEKK